MYYESCCFSDIGTNDVRTTSTLTTTDTTTLRVDGDDRFVLINAWNEWAEGMAMEPSDVYGRKFLETIRDTKNEVLQSK
jgi:hypothetical protein